MTERADATHGNPVHVAELVEIDLHTMAEKAARELFAYYADVSFATAVIERALAKLQEQHEAEPASFWVVERFEHERSAGYWDGGHSRSFLPDIEKAVQFRRREDCFWATRGWHWTDTKFTEHIELCVPQAPSGKHVLRVRAEGVEAARTAAVAEEKIRSLSPDVGGKVLVSREPTDAMLLAANDAIGLNGINYDHVRIWEAMLAAAERKP